MAFEHLAIGDDPLARADDFLRGLPIEHQVGLLFQPPISIRNAGASDGSREQTLSEIAELIRNKHVRHFNIRGPLRGTSTPRAVARFLNDIQRLAASCDYAVPVSISTDPRHGFANRPGMSISSGYLSRWPEPIAFGALDDPERLREFAGVVRTEYRALGIHVALHPQADLATDPRWMRISGTFGQDPDRVSTLVAAYIRGLQGERVGPTSVSCVTKHFPGGGAQLDGEDPHFAYGKDQVYPGGFFEEHVRPFAAAIAAGTSQVMPYYTRPVGTQFEEVGFAFNAGIIRGILRERLGFDGIVLSDWGVLTPGELEGQRFPALAWGVENLTPSQRTVKALAAGIDQFGGEHCTDIVLDLINRGEVDPERITESARRLLREKFALGIFDEPFVDPAAAEDIVGRAQFVDRGRVAQRESMVVLKNDVLDGTPMLPLGPSGQFRTVGMEDGLLDRYNVSADVSNDGGLVAIVRAEAPYEPRTGVFERWHRAGRLAYTPEELQVLLVALGEQGVFVIDLERPAVIPEILESARAVVGFCGADDEAILDVLFGRAVPRGRLPFDLPRSMAAVETHHPDRPGGSDDPLLRAGWRADTSGWFEVSDDA